MLSPSASNAKHLPSPQGTMLLFAFFNATTWMVALGTPMVLLAGELGASSFQVGLAYSFVFILLPIQILATYTLPRFGYKRQAIFGWGSRGLFLFIPLFLAWLAPAHPEPWMVHLLIASVLLFALFRSTGSCALMPLFYHNLAEDNRGRYFSTDQSVTALSGIFTLLLGAALFKWLPVYDAFLVQYMYAILGTGLSVWFLARIPDAPRPEITRLAEIIQESPRVCIRPSPFRQYLWFMIFNGLISTAFVPLTTYYLKVELMMASERIMLLTAIQYAGAILGTMMMRNRIDHIGAKAVFRISIAAGAAISLYWIALIHNFPGARMLLPVAFFGFGLSISNWVVASLKYLPSVCSQQRQALHVSIHGALVGLVGGMAPILWGFIVRPNDGGAGVNIHAFTLYFCALILVQVGIFFYVPRLTPQYRGREALQLASSILRPFRYMSQLIHLQDPAPDRKRPKSAAQDGSKIHDPNN
jgi:MFS family permease